MAVSAPGSSIVAAKMLLFQLPVYDVTVEISLYVYLTNVKFDYQSQVATIRTLASGQILFAIFTIQMHMANSFNATSL